MEFVAATIGTSGSPRVSILIGACIQIIQHFSAFLSFFLSLFSLHISVLRSEDRLNLDRMKKKQWMQQWKLLIKNNFIITLIFFSSQPQQYSTVQQCASTIFAVQCYIWGWGLDPLKSKLVRSRPWVWPQLRASDNNADHNLPMEMSPLIFMPYHAQVSNFTTRRELWKCWARFSCPARPATYTFHLRIKPPLGGDKNFPSRMALRQRWRKFIKQDSVKKARSSNILLGWQLAWIGGWEAFFPKCIFSGD